MAERAVFSGHDPPTAPINDQVAIAERACFICLQTEADAPSESWAKPCPCSLESHETCMLRWIAETETSGDQKKDKAPRCPACQARIRVDEPRDVFLVLRSRMHRSYSWLTPWLLTSLLGGCSLAGSAFYGLQATILFAGPRKITEWLPALNGPARRGVTLWRSAAGWAVALWTFSLLGPGLVLVRAFPPLGTWVGVPFSLMYGGTLAVRNDMPTWPPSPRWTLTMIPFLHLIYSQTYHEFCGPFEKRLNRALRGQPVVEEVPAREEGAGPARGGDGPRPEQEEGDEGAWTAMTVLARALWNVFNGNDNEGAGVEVNIQIPAAIHEDRWPAGGGPEAVEEGVRVDDELRQLIAPDADVPRQDPVQHPQAQAQPAAAAQPAEQPAAAPAPNPVADPRLHDGADGANRPVSTLNEIVNHIVTSLLLPAISFGVGELIRVAAPRAWITRPWRTGPTGLFQQQWGRSLVGGCLFVVLRDAINLFSKYRRVQVKRRRKIRSVERKRVVASGDSVVIR